MNSVREKYKVVVGLEVHVQLQTQSKIFSGDSNSYGDDPNTNISAITLGHPGVLPMLNKKAVEYAIKMGLACDSEINRINHFDRKNYFYPDLPKGYQITQDRAPICIGGHVPIQLSDGSNKEIRLNRIHMEEDAGKSIHLQNENDTLVDYNRAGVPLIEIVTEPEISSAEEASLVLNEIRKIVRYLRICDGNMEEGSMRCDANISIMPANSTVLGKKVEVKNMNSMKNVQRAINYEVQRQIKETEAGNSIPSETRTFNDQNGTTAGMRTKEELNDYRYFPDPDLSPLVIDEAWLERLKKSMPALPREIKSRLVDQYGLPEYDAAVLTESREMAEYFEEACSHTQKHKAISNWLMGPVKSWLNESNQDINDFKISPLHLAQLINMIDQGKVSNSLASKEIFPAMIADPSLSPLNLAEQNNFIQNSDSDVLLPIIDEILQSLPDKVKAYRNGKKGLIGLFMGELMKKSKGKADPKLANELLRNKLEGNE